MAFSNKSAGTTMRGAALATKDREAREQCMLMQELLAVGLATPEDLEALGFTLDEVPLPPSSSSSVHHKSSLYVGARPPHQQQQQRLAFGSPPCLVDTLRDAIVHRDSPIQRSNASAAYTSAFSCYSRKRVLDWDKQGSHADTAPLPIHPYDVSALPNPASRSEAPGVISGESHTTTTTTALDDAASEAEAATTPSHGGAATPSTSAKRKMLGAPATVGKHVSVCDRDTSTRTTASQTRQYRADSQHLGLGFGGTSPEDEEGGKAVMLQFLSDAMIITTRDGTVSAAASTRPPLPLLKGQQPRQQYLQEDSPRTEATRKWASEAQRENHLRASSTVQRSIAQASGSAATSGFADGSVVGEGHCARVLTYDREDEEEEEWDSADGRKRRTKTAEWIPGEDSAFQSIEGNSDRSNYGVAGGNSALRFTGIDVLVASEIASRLNERR